MSAVDYLFQGVGVTPSEGLAATAATLGAQSINTAAGAAYLFAAAHAQGGQSWGLKIQGTSAVTANVRMLADSGGVGVTSKTWARTIADSAPDKLPLSGESWTLHTMRYFDSTGNARGPFVQVRLAYLSGTTATLRLYTSTNNTYYDFAGSAVVTAGQKYAMKLRGVIGSTAAAASTGDGTLIAQLFTAAGFTDTSTPDGTISVSNANLLAFPCEVADRIYSGMSAGAGTVTFGAGYDRVELGRTTLIPLVAASAPAVDSGTATAIDAAGAWTVPSGSVLTNITDNDAATYAESSAAPATRDELRFALPRLNPKTSLTVTIDWAVVNSGSLIPDVRLYQGAALKGTVTVGSSTSTATLPASVTFSDVSGITADAGGKWTDLHVGIGAVAG